MEIRFDGKRALVTGASKGIGREIAVQLVKCGATVIAMGRTQSELDSLKAQSPEGRVETICLDLTDWSAVEATINAHQPYDLLVNNAGLAICEPMSEIKQESVDSMVGINVKALINVTRLVTSDMARRGASGAIVNISSQASLAGLDDHAVYAATKGAIDSFTRTLAVELGPKGIRTNCVNPTVITTAMSLVGWSDPARAKWMTDQIPIGRFGDAIDVANPVLFLLSDKAAMINGAIIPIDGGFLAR